MDEENSADTAERGGERAAETKRGTQMERCESCQRLFGQRCARDNRITQRCGGCGRCSRITCCGCELGSDFGSSDSEPEQSPIRTPRTRGRCEQQLSHGEHSWSTTSMTLDELLVDSFASRQRVWSMTALLHTPEKRERPKKAVRRRGRQRRRRRLAGQQ